MNKIITVFLLLTTTIGYAQNRKQKIIKKAENKINISFTPQLYLNSSGISGHNKANVFSTENTTGYHFGVDYQRTTKYKLIYGGGLYYGTQNHRLKAKFDDASYFNHPDPTVQALVNELPSVEYPIQGKVSFGDIRLMVGYRFNISAKRNLFMEAKIGASSRFYRNHPNDGYQRLNIGYVKNDTLFIHTQADLSYRVGYNSSTTSWGQNYNLYLGVVKKMNTRFIKDLSVGIELNHSMRRQGNSYASARLFRSDGSLYSVEDYKSKDFAIGLRMSVGLWHK